MLQLDYGYGATNANNGNVLTQTITIGATVMTQSYSYDALNRLSSASEGPAWSQTYDCDRYGNRAVRVGSYIPQPQLTPQSSSPTDFSAFNQGTNRIASSGFGYDAAGNLTGDPTTAANAMVYDAENRQISYTKAGVTTTYTYDGDGKFASRTSSMPEQNDKEQLDPSEKRRFVTDKLYEMFMANLEDRPIDLELVEKLYKVFLEKRKKG
jgi:YD repeat-containing protein